MKSRFGKWKRFASFKTSDKQLDDSQRIKLLQNNDTDDDSADEKSKTIKGIEKFKTGQKKQKFRKSLKEKKNSKNKNKRIVEDISSSDDDGTRSDAEEEELLQKGKNAWKNRKLNIEKSEEYAAYDASDEPVDEPVDESVVAADDKIADQIHKSRDSSFYKISPASNLVELSRLKNTDKIIGEVLIENITDRQMIFLIKPTDSNIFAVKPFRGVVQPFKTQAVRIHSQLELSSQLANEGLKLELMQLEDFFDVDRNNMFDLFNSLPHDPTKIVKIYVYCKFGGKTVTEGDDIYSLFSPSHVTRMNKLLRHRHNLYQMSIGVCKITTMLLGIFLLGLAAYLYSSIE